MFITKAIIQIKHSKSWHGLLNTYFYSQRKVFINSLFIMNWPAKTCTFAFWSRLTKQRMGSRSLFKKDVELIQDIFIESSQKSCNIKIFLSYFEKPWSVSSLVAIFLQFQKRQILVSNLKVIKRNKIRESWEGKRCSVTIMLF